MDAAVAEHRVGAAPLAEAVVVCALAVEERAARRSGLEVTRIGLGAARGVPDGALVGLGLAGALREDLPPGTLLTASAVVGEDGETLWEAPPLELPGATTAVVCAMTRVVDGRAERAELARRTGADAADMESAMLAATGRLAGILRVVSDGPSHPLGRLAGGSRPDGGVAWAAVARAFLAEPVRSVRASLRARAALAELERAARLLREARR